MQQSFKDLARRHDNAVIRWREALALDIFGEFTSEEADAILTFYLKHKLVTIDHMDGRVKVKHGAYLEVDVLRNALDSVEEVDK